MHTGVCEYMKNEHIAEAFPRGRRGNRRVPGRPIQMATNLADVQLGTPGYGVASLPERNNPSSVYDTKLSFYNPDSDSTSHGPSPYSEEPASQEIRTEHCTSEGRAAKYLESKGFGWLMEMEEGDEEDTRPLL